MICPRCKREVETVYGNGTYPNSSYFCDRCDAEGTERLIKWIAVPIAVVVVGGLIASIVCEVLGC